MNYISDQPIRTISEDVLWGNNSAIRYEIGRVAEQIAYPILSKKEQHSMTFAVHGKWGTGKSSVLQSIQAQVETQLVSKSLAQYFKHHTISARVSETVCNERTQTLRETLIGAIVIALTDGNPDKLLQWVNDNIPSASDIFRGCQEFCV